jgi:hypothetical protein
LLLLPGLVTTEKHQRQMLSMFDQSIKKANDDDHEAELVFQKIKALKLYGQEDKVLLFLKKFPKNLKVKTALVEYYLVTGEFEKAREIAEEERQKSHGMSDLRNKKLRKHWNNVWFEVALQWGDEEFLRKAAEELYHETFHMEYYNAWKNVHSHDEWKIIRRRLIGELESHSGKVYEYKADKLAHILINDGLFDQLADLIERRLTDPKFVFQFVAPFWDFAPTKAFEWCSSAILVSCKKSTTGEYMWIEEQLYLMQKYAPQKEDFEELLFIIRAKFRSKRRLIEMLNEAF